MGKGYQCVNTVLNSQYNKMILRDSRCTVSLAKAQYHTDLCEFLFIHYVGEALKQSNLLLRSFY